jgi:hypothetical protein
MILIDTWEAAGLKEFSAWGSCLTHAWPWCKQAVFLFKDFMC